jgi:predicted deacylase
VDVIAGRAAEPVTVAGEATAPGERRRFEVHAARLVTGGWLAIPVEVLVGARPGPRVWLSGAIHGDELDGIEIIRRVLDALDPAALSGSLIAVPIVNVFAFIGESRYLPDRRALNSSFPGSESGSLAARIAHLFMRQVVAQCDLGIDFHCGSDSRVNLPQVRIDVEDATAAELAMAFGAPVVMHARAPAGSLRAAAGTLGASVLVYEGGQAGRFSEGAIRQGVGGVRRVLAALGMTAAPAATPGDPGGGGVGDPGGGGADDPAPTLVARNSLWVRAGRSGILRMHTELGAEVAAGQRLGVIADAFGDRASNVRARGDGIVVGLTSHPLVNRGDAIAHIALPE